MGFLLYYYYITKMYYGLTAETTTGNNVHLSQVCKLHEITENSKLRFEKPIKLWKIPARFDSKNYQKNEIALVRCIMHALIRWSFRRLFHRIRQLFFYF